MREQETRKDRHIFRYQADPAKGHAAYTNTEVHISNTFYLLKSDLSELRFRVKDGILEATPLQ